MTRTLALALAPQVRVLSVSPGVVSTDFVPGRTHDWIVKGGAATPLGKVTEPGDVAEVIFAAAVHLRHSNGTRLVVDTGRSL